MSDEDEEYETPVYVRPAERVAVLAEPARQVHEPVAEDAATSNITVETDVLDPQPVDDPRDVDDSDAHVDSPLDAAAWRLRHILRLQREAGAHATSDAGAEPLPITTADSTDLDPPAFPARYYHAGAFFADAADRRTAELLARDYSQPTARDVAAAQATQQGTGRRGRSKWTRLATEDTTDGGYSWGGAK
jgi:hypothetical protein